MQAYGRHKLRSSVIGGYRSMTCWTCEQLRQSAVHLRRRISESILIARLCTLTIRLLRVICCTDNVTMLYLKSLKLSLPREQQYLAYIIITIIIILLIIWCALICILSSNRVKIVSMRCLICGETCRTQRKWITSTDSSLSVRKADSEENNVFDQSHKPDSAITTLTPVTRFNRTDECKALSVTLENPQSERISFRRPLALAVDAQIPMSEFNVNYSQRGISTLQVQPADSTVL